MSVIAKIKNSFEKKGATCQVKNKIIKYSIKDVERKMAMKTGDMKTISQFKEIISLK